MIRSRGESDVFIQSRDLRPLDRYFPELHATFLDLLPAGCVIDGEIVIATPEGLDFDALQLRLHPAASRVATLSKAAADGVSIDEAVANTGDAGNGHAHPSPLSRRETQIAHLIDRGLTNKEIGRELGIEAATVKNHVHNMCEKLNVHRRGEAAAIETPLLRASHIHLKVYQNRIAKRG